MVYRRNPDNLISTRPFRTLLFRGSVASLLAIAAFGCSSEGPTDEQLLAAADAAFNEGHYDKAVNNYRRILRRSEQPRALRQLAIIYSDQGQAQQAFPLLRGGASAWPNDTEIQLRFGQILLAFGEPAQAREAAFKVLAQRPGDEEALLLLADTAAAIKDFAEVRDLIVDLRRNDRERAGYHLALGALYARQKDNAHAENEFKAAIEDNPKSSSAYMMLGLLRWSQNDLTAADEALKAAADLSPLRSPIRTRYADFLIRTRSTAEARAYLEDLNRKIPDGLPPRVILMTMACGEQRDENCANRVKDVLAQDPTNVDATLQNGILSLSKGDVLRAIRDFEYASNALPGNAQIRYQLAQAYLRSAEHGSEADNRKAAELAESYLSEAINLDPRFEQAVLAYAELKLKKGTAAAAIDLLVRLIADRPQIAKAHYLLAAAYLAQNRSDQAMEVYRKMAGLFPTDPQPLFAIGNIWLSQSNRSESRRALERALEISPDYLPALEMLVELDIVEKDPHRGIGRVQQRINVDPNRALLWALRAKLHIGQRDFSQAETDLLKAIELDETLTPAYLMLAQVYVASNRQQEAIERLNAAAAKGKGDAALLLLASVHEQAKNFPAARDTYEKLLTSSSTSVVALNNLAVIYADHFGQLDKALDLAKRARERNPDNPNLADTLGWILFRKGDHAQALRLIQESARTLTNNPEIQFHLGMAHYMLGEEQPADAALKRAVDSQQDFIGKTDARQRLSILAIKPASDDARADLQNYLKQQPNDPIALSRLAAFQERDGATDQAMKTYEKIASEYPLFAPAIRRLALLYSQRPADGARAFELATKARQAFPDDADVAKALGILNYGRELYPRAVELLRQASVTHPNDSELLYYLGDSHRRLKQWDDCKLALEKAIKLNLTPSLADQARRGYEECVDKP